jgi:hypothetical protein
MKKLIKGLKMAKSVLATLLFVLKYVYDGVVQGWKWLYAHSPILAEKLANTAKKSKAITGKIRLPEGSVYDWIVKIWKSLQALPEMSVTYTLLGCWGLSYLIYVALNHYIGHGDVVSVAHPAADVMIPTVAPLAGIAWPFAILIAVGLPIFLLYVDVKHNKKDDSE